MNTESSDGRTPLRKRLLPRLLLVAALLGAAWQLLPALPREQVLVFRFPKADAARRLDATWTSSGEDEPRGGVSLTVPPQALRVEHRARIPNGEYAIEAELVPQADGVPKSATPRADFSEQPSRMTYHETVTLQGGMTTIRIQDEEP